MHSKAQKNELAVVRSNYLHERDRGEQDERLVVHRNDDGDVVSIAISESDGCPCQALWECAR
jgi:hypothetical protein